MKPDGLTKDIILKSFRPFPRGYRPIEIQAYYCPISDKSMFRMIFERAKTFGIVSRMRRVGKARRRKAFGVIIIDDPLTRSGVLTDKELAYMDSIYKRRELGRYCGNVI